MNQPDLKPVSASFRDPSGYVFIRNGEFHRLISNSYRENYDLLMGSGLYSELVDRGLLIPHQEAAPAATGQDAYKIIRPEQVPFISYPYEWCFSQLKDAALATLEIQSIALKYGMSLKDSSAYNIQYVGGKPVLIDTLSFEKYVEGKPWVAYKQFCQHFLAPLALIKYTDVRLNQLLRIYLDGIPLDLASTLLPFKSKFSFPILFHLHLHAKSQTHFADKRPTGHTAQVSKNSFLGLLESLQGAVTGLSWAPDKTEWAGYYQDTNYTAEAMAHKRKLIGELLDSGCAGPVWDLGANTGEFSRIAAGKKFNIIAFDCDPGAVELNYRNCVKTSEVLVLPLITDLSNPSADRGWANEERMSITRRGPAGTVMALALIHHLAISNNVPLTKIAQFFQRITDTLIIEFVPKADSNTQRLLSTRPDIFPNYNESGFTEAFSPYFKIERTCPVSGSERTLYLMRNKSKTPG